MTIEELNKLKGQRAQLVKDMRALSDLEATRALTADEQEKYAKMEKDFDEKTAAINRADNLNAREAQLRNERDSDYRAAIENPSQKRKARASAEYKEAFFDGFIRKGPNNLGPKYMNVLSEGVDTDGGYLVPTATEEAIYKAIYDENPIRAYADVKTSAIDSAIPVRTGIPTFAWLGEGGTYGTTGSTYGKLAMHAHKCGGIIPISDELLQDAAENMEAEINETAGLAFADLESESFMVGNGVAKPLGLFAPSEVAGVTIPTVTTAGATAITSDELIDLYYAIKVGYRRKGTFVMADATEKYIRKLKNATTGDYMWQPGLTAGAPDTLLGRPVVVCPDVAAIAATNKTIAFGDLKAFRIRDRLGISVKPLNEKYADIGQVGYRFTKRTDAKLVDALAVAFLVQHA